MHNPKRGVVSVFSNRFLRKIQHEQERLVQIIQQNHLFTKTPRRFTVNYWQIATGSEGRYYAEYFLKYGIALVGAEEYINRIREVQPGDVVILKSGIQKIVAVGHAIERNGVCSGERESRGFDGWDLGGYCYVNWHIPPEPIAVTGLTQGTILGVGDSRPKNQADKIMATYDVQTCYDPEPRIQKIDDEKILNFLIREGLRPGAAEDLTGASVEFDDWLAIIEIMPGMILASMKPELFW